MTLYKPAWVVGVDKGWEVGRIWYNLVEWREAQTPAYQKIMREIVQEDFKEQGWPFFETVEQHENYLIGVKCGHHT